MIGKILGHGHFDRGWNGKLALQRRGHHRFFLPALSLLQSRGTTGCFHNNSLPLTPQPEPRIDSCVEPAPVVRLEDYNNGRYAQQHLSPGQRTWGRYRCEESWPRCAPGYGVRCLAEFLPEVSRKLNLPFRDAHEADRPPARETNN